MHRRWWVWGTLLPAFVISYFHRVGLAAVGDALKMDFHVGAAALGLLSSLYFYVYAVMQVPAGVLADTHGPRRVVTVSLAVTALGTAIFALAPSYGVAAAGRLLVGLGVSSIFPCILKIQAEWFPVRVFGTLSGLLVLVGNLSGLLAYTPTAIAAGAIGWRAFFGVMGVVTLVILVAVWVVVRDRPADVGLPAPDGALPAPGVGGPGGSNLRAALRTALRAVAGNWRTWPPVLAGFGTYGTLIAFSGAWAVPYLRDIYGMDRLQATALAQLLLLGMALCAPVAGWISDRLRIRRLPYMILASLLVLIMGWLAFGQPPRAWIGLVFFGAGAGAAGFALGWAATKEVNLPAYAGLAVGFSNMGGFVGVALLQPLFGLILDRGGTSLAGYHQAFLVLLGSALLALVSSVLLTETRARNIARE